MSQRLPAAPSATLVVAATLPTTPTSGGCEVRYHAHASHAVRGVLYALDREPRSDIRLYTLTDGSTPPVDLTDLVADLPARCAQAWRGARTPAQRQAARETALGLTREATAAVKARLRAAR